MLQQNQTMIFAGLFCLLRILHSCNSVAGKEEKFLFTYLAAMETTVPPTAGLPPLLRPVPSATLSSFVRPSEEEAEAALLKRNESGDLPIRKE